MKNNSLKSENKILLEDNRRLKNNIQKLITDYNNIKEANKEVISYNNIIDDFNSLEKEKKKKKNKKLINSLDISKVKKFEDFDILPFTKIL